MEDKENKKESLYDILNIDKTASKSDIRKGYFVAAKQWHPDKNSSEEAKNKFQEIGKAYEVLFDEKKKSIYDKTGIISGEEDFLSENKDWEQYWRALYKQVEIDDILNFEKTYKNSDEELKDLIENYKKFKGNFDKMMSSIMLANENDFERFTNIINDRIEQKELKLYQIWTKTSTKAAHKKRKLTTNSESKEAEELLEMFKRKDQSKNTGKQITKRQKEMEDLASSLEAKYSGNKKSKTKVQEEPSEEEFLKARQNIEKRKAENTKKGPQKKKRKL